MGAEAHRRRRTRRESEDAHRHLGDACLLPEKTVHTPTSYPVWRVGNCPSARDGLARETMLGRLCAPSTVSTVGAYVRKVPDDGYSQRSQ